MNLVSAHISTKQTHLKKKKYKTKYNLMNSVSQKLCSLIGTSPCTKCLGVWGEMVRVIGLAAYCNYLSKILWIQLQISIQNYWEIETLLCIDHPITFICSNWENLRNLIDVDISGDSQLSKVLWLVYGSLKRGGEKQQGINGRASSMTH